MEIPRISLAAPEAEIVAPPRRAAEAHGFFYVLEDHGVDAALLPGDAGVTACATFLLTEEAEVEVMAARVAALGGRVVKGPCRT